MRSPRSRLPPPRCPASPAGLAPSLCPSLSWSCSGHAFMMWRLRFTFPDLCPSLVFLPWDPVQREPRGWHQASEVWVALSQASTEIWSVGPWCHTARSDSLLHFRSGRGQVRASLGLASWFVR